MSLQKMEESIKIFEGEREFLKTQLLSKTQEQDKLDTERQILSERVSSLQNELKISQDSLLETSRDQSIIEQLKDQVSRLEGEIRTTSDELAHMQQINDEATKINREQAAMLDDLQEKMTHQEAVWQNKRKELEQDLLSLQSSLTGAQEREKEYLSHQKELEEQLQASTEQVGTLSAELEEMQREKDATPPKANQEPVIDQELSQEVTALKSEREQLMEARTMLEEERDHFRAECENRDSQKQKQIDDLLLERERIQKQLVQREEEMTQYRDTVDSLNTELALEKEKVAKITKDRGDLLPSSMP